MKMTVSTSFGPDFEPNKTPPLLLAWLLVVLGVTVTALMCWPLVKVARARNWVETPCVILASSVKTHADSDGDTYSVRVSYEYEIGGRKFVGDRYKFMGGSSSGYEGKSIIVRALPKGKQTVCYVNPADHHESVLERGLTGDMAFTAIPLMFTLVGAALLFNRRREGRKWRLPTLVLGGSIFVMLGAAILGIFLGTEGTTPVKIKGSIGVWWLIVSGLTLFIIIGSGVIINYFRQLKPPKVSAGTLVLRESAVNELVFGLFGAGLLIFNFIGYELVIKNGAGGMWPLLLGVLLFDLIFLFILTSRFAPKPRLTLRDGDLHAGSRLDLEWDFERSGRVKQLSFSLQGVYKDYDKKYPDTFADHPLLLNITDPKQIRYGTLTFNLPADLRPTSRDADGQVAWKITAEITTGTRFLSTTKREYPVTISGAG